MVLQQNRTLQILDKSIYQFDALISNGAEEASSNPSYILPHLSYREGHPRIYSLI